MEKEVKQRKVSALPNFGAKGWYVIIVLACVMFIGLSLQSEGHNVTDPGFTAMGLDLAQINVFKTMAGWFGVVGSFLFGLLATKVGGKNVLLIALVGWIVAIMLWGGATTELQYFAGYAAILFCLNGAMSMGLGNIISNWFPRKKGAVMGWVTLGASMSPIAAIPLYSAIVAAVGFRMFFIVVGIILVAIFLCSLILKNRPEEWGAYPDNDKSMTPEMAKALLQITEDYKKTSPFTFKKLLTTSQTWFTAIGLGVLLLVPVGFMSSIVMRGTSPQIGLEIPQVVLLITIGGVVNAFWSLLTGVIDTKFGTKKAAYMCYAFYIVGLAIVCFPGVTPFYIGSFLIILVSGGVNNLTISMTVSIFGRYDFAKALTIITPISVVTRTLGYTLVGAITATQQGDFTLSNIILFIVMAIGIILLTVNKVKPIGRTEDEFDQDAAKLAAQMGNKASEA